MKIAHSVGVFIGILGALIGLEAVAADTIYIGFIEERNTGERRETYLRVAYQKTDAGWSTVCPSKPEFSSPRGCTFPNADRTHSWNVSQSGIVLGNVSTLGWHPESAYWRAAQLRISSASIPKVGNPTDEFMGWVGEKVHRPLVATNSKVIAGVQNWQPQVPSKADTDRVRASLIRLVKQVPSCTFDDDQKPKGKARPIQYNDIDVFRVLRNGRDERLIGVRLKNVAKNCAESGGLGSDIWFYVAPQSEPLPVVGGSLDGWPFAFTLLDIVDLDGDGKAEVIF